MWYKVLYSEIRSLTPLGLIILIILIISMCYACFNGLKGILIEIIILIGILLLIGMKIDMNNIQI